MTIDDFIGIATREVGDVPTSCKRLKCDDQSFGTISDIQNSDFQRQPIIERTQRTQEVGRLIMILESPHKKEFSEGEPPKPANGGTGKNIKRYLLRVNGLSKYVDSELIVMNAIQYQCSLGCHTKRYRDKIFRACWNEGGRGDFINRLHGVYRDGDVILNCCTKGNSSEDDLRNMVCNALLESFQDALKLGRTHPSSWYRPENRNFTYECR